MNSQIKTVGQRFVNSGDVISVVRFPHPLTEGGLLIVLNGSSPTYLNSIATAYQQFPKERSLYCLRPNELFQLWQPGVFAPPFHINEQPHLPFYLKYKGCLLAGEPLAHKINLPQCSAGLLAMHIEACRDSLRRYGILPLLFQRKYRSLVNQLIQEMAYLMATALLTRGIWEISLDTIQDPFFAAFSSSILREMVHLIGQISEETAVSQTAVSQSITYDAIFYFETFLKELALEIKL